MQLRDRLIKVGLTEYELSQRSGVGRATVSRLMAGENKHLYLDTAVRLADASNGAFTVDDMIKAIWPGLSTQNMKRIRQRELVRPLRPR